MSCETCGCDCEDYIAELPKFHNHPIGGGKSKVIFDSIEGAPVKIIDMTFDILLPEDLLGLPVRD